MAAQLICRAVIGIVMLFGSVSLAIAKETTRPATGAVVINDCWKTSDGHSKAVECADLHLQSRQKELDALVSREAQAAFTAGNEMHNAGSLAYDGAHLKGQVLKSEQAFKSYVGRECERQVSQVMGGSFGADAEIRCRLDLIDERIASLKRRGFAGRP